MRFGVLAIVLLTARLAGAAEDAEIVDEEVVVDVDAVSGSHETVPRPAPLQVLRDGDRLIVGCLQLRMVPDYDGHSILALTFLRDGRCGQTPEEGKPPDTP